jgi:hypothetical protein
MRAREITNAAELFAKPLGEFVILAPSIASIQFIEATDSYDRVAQESTISTNAVLSFALETNVESSTFTSYYLPVRFGW